MRTCDRSSQRGRPWRYSFLVALLVGVGGCGTPRCDVSGKVTYQGKTVVCGTITFVGSDGMPIVVPIQSDGAYQAKQVPVGPVQVAVLSLDPARPLNPFRVRKPCTAAFQASGFSLLALWWVLGSTTYSPRLNSLLQS